jgi:hypothetical protein
VHGARSSTRCASEVERRRWDRDVAARRAPPASTCATSGDDALGIASTRPPTREPTSSAARGLRRRSRRASLDDLVAGSPAAGPAGALARTLAFLTHPVFHAHHSETEMLRYLHRLRRATSR